MLRLRFVRDGDAPDFSAAGPVFRIGANICARRSVLLDWIGDQEGEPLGALVRKHTRLSIKAKRDQRMGASAVHIVADLPPCHENESAVFARWQIVVGEGLAKRVLRIVDAREASEGT